jgi:hypothetical protein
MEPEPIVDSLIQDEVFENIIIRDIMVCHQFTF